MGTLDLFYNLYIYGINNSIDPSPSNIDEPVSSQPKCKSHKNIQTSKKSTTTEKSKTSDKQKDESKKSEESDLPIDSDKSDSSFEEIIQSSHPPSPARRKSKAPLWQLGEKRKAINVSEYDDWIPEQSKKRNRGDKKTNNKKDNSDTGSDAPKSKRGGRGRGMCRGRAGVRGRARGRGK